MAQEQQITFITEDIAPATSFIQSGRSLRLSYVARQKSSYITTLLIEDVIDPLSISEKEWEDLESVWKKEAEIKYPDEGGYKVWLIDLETNLPVPLGEVVEFIGGDVRENKGEDIPNPEEEIK